MISIESLEIRQLKLELYGFPEICKILAVKINFDSAFNFWS